MASVDFKALREKVRLIDACHHAGFASDYIHENCPRGPCPLDCMRDVRCCRYNWQRGLWYCHRCGRGGNAIQLYAWLTGLTMYQAAIELCLKIGIQVPYLPRSKDRKPRQPRIRKNRVADGRRGGVD